MFKRIKEFFKDMKTNKEKKQWFVIITASLIISIGFTIGQNIYNTSKLTIEDIKKIQSEKIKEYYKDSVYIKDLPTFMESNSGSIISLTLPDNTLVSYLEILRINKETKLLEKVKVYKDVDKDWKDYGIDFTKYAKDTKIGFFEETSTNVIKLIGDIISTALMIFFLFFIIRMFKDGPFGFTKDSMDKITLFVPSDKNKIGFNDMGGNENLKQDITEVIKTIDSWELYDKQGVRPLRGVLLYGEPGVGKTMIAKIIASQTNIPMFIANGGNFKNAYVGAGQKIVQDTFEKIKTYMKEHNEKFGILFIDEIDSIAGSRDSNRSHSEDVSTLNQLLSQIDGVKGATNIIVIAATNYADRLDAAFASRMDKKIFVPLPSYEGRLDILKKKIAKVREKDENLVDSDIDLSILAHNTMQMSGRDLDTIINDALMEAIREGKKITQPLLQEIFERYVIGRPNLSIKLNPKDREVVCYHELGHAVVGLIEGKRVHKVTILPIGPALGVTWNSEFEEKHLRTPSEILGEIRTLLAGRMAESIFIGDITTGASNDYERATKLANSYLMNYNFSYKVNSKKEIKLGYTVKDLSQLNPADQKFVADSAKTIIEEEEKKVNKILSKYKSKMETLAIKLKEKEELFEQEIKEGILG